MKILKFRIWNYKSIIDSGDCYPANGVTVFAGKNESGKTSILEALQDFNVGTDIRAKAIPIKNKELRPQVSVWFKVSRDIIKQIFDDIKFSFEVLEEEVVFLLSKQYPNIYSTNQESVELIGLSTVALREQNKIANQTSLQQLSILYNSNVFPLTKVGFPDIDFNDTDDFKIKIDALKTLVQPHLSKFPEELQRILNKEIDYLIGFVNSCVGLNSQRIKFVEGFKKRIPNFILFSSFDDIFPNFVPLSDLSKNQWIKDLELVSDLKVQTILSSDEREKATHKRSLNIKLNEEYERFWEQDFSELLIEWDNQKLSFWIVEDGYFYEPDIRSKGKQWHLAFYIRVTARSREDKLNIILIDEPGLYLHAKAQRDILKKLDEASSDAPVMISTHSPYLLEADKLERIRLVQKTKEQGTSVENKIHKVADKETLTPILTAIGLEMVDGIHQVDKFNNVIVEGPSDYYYLQAFKRIKKNENLNFIFGGGAGNMPKVGTILQGWGTKVVYLYDDDKGMKEAVKNVKAEWVITTKEMIEKLPVPDGAIEDIFSTEDYKKIILDDPKADVKSLNSAYAKISKRDKVLDSKLFLESLKNGNIDLDHKTMNNVDKLFHLLDKRFKDINGSEKKAFK